MNAAVFYGPNNIANECVYYNNDHRAGGLSLRVKASAICGFDSRVFRTGHRKVIPPIILGHEICGQTDRDVIVSAANDKETDTLIKAGSRVAVSPIIPCLNCRYCYNKKYNLCINLKEIGSNINGGFAEYLMIPEEILKIGGLVSVPNNLGNEEATLLEPLACCLNGFSQIGPTTREEKTMVIIGDGPIGLLHLQISKLVYGIKTIVVGKIPHRIEEAKRMGADAAIKLSVDVNGADGEDRSPDKQAIRDILDITDGMGADLIVIATSNPVAVGFAQKIASKNSRINIFAGMTNENKRLSFDANWLHYNQITITGSFSCTPNMLRQAAKLASNRRINLSKIVTHRYSLAEIKEAIMATEKYSGLRVVINDF